MIAHHGISPDRDSEHVSQLMYPVLDPTPAMRERLPGVAIGTTEKGAPYATRNAVEGSRRTRWDELASAYVMRASIAPLSRPDIQKTRGLAVGKFRFMGVPCRCLQGSPGRGSNAPKLDQTPEKQHQKKVQFRVDGRRPYVSRVVSVL
jgi:hypothetical protein